MAEGDFIYQRVADELRQGISGEEWGPGDRLPTRAQLAERFDVSPATINEALKRLRGEGLIVTRQGSGTFVRGGPHGDGRAASQGARAGEGAGGPGGPWAVMAEGVKPVKLGPYLAEAFEASEVTLDVFSMTTETLAKRVSDLKDRFIQENIPPPRSIKARLMLPDCDSPMLTIPRRVDGEDDPRVRQRLKSILQSHATMFQEALFELQRCDPAPEVDVEVRVVPCSPQMKLYILNRSLALQGFYVVDVGSIPLPPGREEVRIYDAYGTGATLFPYRVAATAKTAGSGQRDIVQECQAFFDSYWNHQATRVDL
ncbi:winged helix-turn-helix domain-containing protein [Streptomyces sp. NBC_00338]|uniref:winged helix-turn-helix domain-containing protein n=1 Tax=unclassified Streptomyces TaxID=2593676 RepID=UPI0022577CEB|nr:winged helix-turn-helix domain-containing protein [Streptomyces sp. NBC_00338]MCX5141747.1 winged helix-turn-helix domain-containing protein [Streptomyces sp. NBC_00338]WSU60247.1 winged helix-turn-helix domain-containing protein [Streptomyces sp. NBC_01104]